MSYAFVVVVVSCRLSLFLVAVFVVDVVCSCRYCSRSLLCFGLLLLLWVLCLLLLLFVGFLVVVVIVLRCGCSCGRSVVVVLL